MGWYFRKSIKIAPGIRLNLSKSGLGVSGGVKGFRISTGPRGTQVNAGSGPLRYRKNLSFGKGHPEGPEGQADVGTGGSTLFKLAKFALFLIFLLIVIVLVLHHFSGTAH